MRRQPINSLPTTQLRPYTRPDKTKIPVQVIWPSCKQAERFPPKQDKSSSEIVVPYGLSVAARKARLQKHDSTAQLAKSRNNNLSTSNIETRCTETKKPTWTVNTESNRSLYRKTDQSAPNWTLDLACKEQEAWSRTSSCDDGKNCEQSN